MYLGKPAISNLRSFLSGYIFARRELDLPQTEEEQEFAEFQSWIKSKFRVSSDQSWDRIILFFSEDENRALVEFFKLFEEFSTAKVGFVKPQAPVRRPDNFTTETIISTESITH